MIRLIITDLDNTLYDWVDYYVPSFLAMVRELSIITKVDAETLKAEFKSVHERYRTTEYSFAIQELDIFKKIGTEVSGSNVIQLFGSAIEKFREVRKQTLRLYDGVETTLEKLHNRGMRIAAATESLEFHACYRLRELKIECLFDALVAPPDHGFPSGTKPEDVRSYSFENYRCMIPIRITPLVIRKPDPMYLSPLLEAMQVSPRECLLVGDSMYKDVVMANRSGIRCCLARYGRVIAPENRAELMKITYWTNEDVEAERGMLLQPVQPDFVIDSFAEVLAIVRKLEHEGRLR